MGQGLKSQRKRPRLAGKLSPTSDAKLSTSSSGTSFGSIKNFQRFCGVS